MTSRPEFDVAIVGASVAGCTAATFFARRGLRVALIERDANPDAYKKICSHYIQACGVPVLQRLGVTEAMEAAGAVKNGYNAISTPFGWIAPPAKKDPRFPPDGYNLRRLKLDPILRRAATGTKGVEYMPGHTARGLIEEDGRFAGVTIAGKDGTTRDIRARLVVGADGRNSRVAELAETPTTIGINNRFNYYTYYRNLAVPSQMTWFHDPDWLFAFPNEDDLWMLCAFPTKEKLADFKRDVHGSFVRLYESLPCGPLLSQSEQVSEMKGMIEIPNVNRRTTQPGLALIGDAALASDPMWGCGIGFALLAAEYLVDATAKPLREGGPKEVDEGLQRYSKKHRSRFGGHAFQIFDYSSGRALNPIEKQFFKAATKDEATSRHFFAFESRHIGLREFVSPRALARASWVNLTRPGDGSMVHPKLRQSARGVHPVAR